MSLVLCGGHFHRRTLLAGQLSHLLHQFPAESDTVSRPAPARCDGVGGRLRGQETGAQASGLSSSAAAVARAIDNGAKIVTGADGVIEKLLAKVGFCHFGGLLSRENNSLVQNFVNDVTLIRAWKTRGSCTLRPTKPQKCRNMQAWRT